MKGKIGVAVPAAILIVAAGAGGLTAGLPADRAEAAFPGQNGRTAFTSDRGPGRNAKVFTMNQRGRDIKRLTPASEHCFGGQSYSADGRTIAVACESGLYTVPAGGGPLTTVVEATDDFSSIGAPSFAPDGRRIAFHATAGPAPLEGPTDIYVINVDGTNLRQLTRRPGEDVDAAWSPNGRRIAYVRIGRTARGKRGIFTMRPSGRDHRRVTPRGIGSLAPSWSPNGRWIAFMAAERRGRFVIARIRPNGGRIRFMITRGETADPAFSPNGRWITYVRLGRRTGLHRARLDGSRERRLTRNRNDRGPDWGPRPRR